MSVYIKGMGMPGKCDSCNVNKCFLWYDYDDSSCRRHPDCPLVEVPEPHGDLVDVDELLKKKWSVLWNGESFYVVNADDLIEAPTVVEEER